MIVDSLFKGHRSRKYTLLAFYTGYVFLAICHYRTESLFDINLFFENIGILFYKESAEIVFSRFKGKDNFFFLFCFSIIFFNGLIKRKFINPSFVASRKKGILYLGLYHSERGFQGSSFDSLER